jgi:hypothetical protein
LARLAHTMGVQSTRSVVARSATSPFDGVLPGLGGARMGKGNGFGDLFALGLTSDVVQGDSLALGATPMIEAVAGARSTKWMGMRPIDSSTSVAQSNGIG